MGEKNQLNRMIEHIKSEYGANPEFLWPDRYPVCAIFRHGDNRKWFALIGAHYIRRGRQRLDYLTYRSNIIRSLWLR